MNYYSMVRKILFNRIISIILILVTLTIGKGMCSQNLCPDLRLKGIPPILPEEKTLREIAAQYTARDSQGNQDNHFLIIYLWVVRIDWKQLIKPIFVDELQGISESLKWFKKADESNHPISIVYIGGGSNQTQLDAARSAVERVSWQNSSIPTYIVAQPRILHDLIRQLGESELNYPLLFRVNSKTLQILESRGESPINAGSWVRMLLNRSPERIEDRKDWAKNHPDDVDESGKLVNADPENIPIDSYESFFRRHIARAAEIMDWREGPFNPHGTIEDTEFIEWLKKTPRRTAVNISPLQEMDPKNPKTLTRERAITATLRFLSIYDLKAASSALAGFLPPSSAGIYAPATSMPQLWKDALSGIPGHETLLPNLVDEVTVALASGYLYDQPWFYPDWNITREEAAWLLARAMTDLDPNSEHATGIIIDASDIDLAPLRLQRRTMAEVYYENESKQQKKIYPQLPEIYRLPSVANGYPPVLYIDQDSPPENVESDLRESWLRQRVGSEEQRRIFKAKRIDMGSNPCPKVIISADDAEEIRKLNAQYGLLDDWRVAIIYGAGARLETPTVDVPRKGPIEIAFTSPMKRETMNADNISLIPSGKAQKEEIEVTLSNDSLVATIRPKNPLLGNAKCEVILGTGLRTSNNRALTMLANSEGEGIARRFEIITKDQMLREDAKKPAYLVVEGEPQSKMLMGEQSLPITLRAMKGAGDINTEFLEVKVKIKPTRCSIIVNDRSYAQEAELALKDTLSFAILADKPGKASVDITCAEEGVQIPKSGYSFICISGPAEEKPRPIENEQHRIPNPNEDGLVLVSPRFRRWLVSNSPTDYPVTVKSLEEAKPATYERDDAGPAKGKFKLGKDNQLLLNFNDKGRMIDISYWIKRGRCAIHFVGARETDQTAVIALQQILADSLATEEYHCLPAAEIGLDGLGIPLPGGELHLSEARQLIEILDLDEIFEGHFSPGTKNTYNLSWVIWSKTDEEPSAWRSMAEDIEPLSLRLDRRVDPVSFREWLNENLANWLAKVGLQPDKTLIERR